jgi:hypothetical protein
VRFRDPDRREVTMLKAFLIALGLVAVVAIARKEIPAMKREIKIMRM